MYVSVSNSDPVVKHCTLFVYFSAGLTYCEKLCPSREIIHSYTNLCRTVKSELRNNRCLYVIDVKQRSK